MRVEFYGDEYGFTVRFYRHCGEGWEKVEALKKKDTSTETHRISTETDTEKDLIKLMENNPAITISEMAEKSGLSRGGVQYVLNSLKTKGKVRRDGSQKRGRWIIL